VLAVLKRSQVADDAPALYDLGHLECWQQVPYTLVGRAVRDRVAALRGQRPQPEVTVAYDRTCVGAAVGDVMEGAGIDAPLVAITIHGGDLVSATSGRGSGFRSGTW
jgi:hypothetical protein